MALNERTRLQVDRVNEEDKCCSMTTNSERRLTFSVVIVTIIGLGIFIGYTSHSKSKTRITTSVCLSPQCVLSASNLLQSLDLKRNPCEDFYSFVCGNWIKNAHLIGQTTTQFTRIDNEITKRGKELLEISHPNATEHENKTRKFYYACMDTQTRNYNGSKILEEDLKNFGGWPLIDKNWNAATFDWSDLMIKFHQNGYPNHMLLSISVAFDIKNMSTRLIAINQPKLMLGDKKHYQMSNDSTIMKRYKDLILALSIHLNPDVDKKTAAEDIEEAFNIEKQLAQVTIPKRNPLIAKDYYHIKTLKEIEKFTPKIPYRYLLKNLLPPNTDLQDEQRIMVSNPLALETLNKMLANLDDKKGKRALANYMMYTAVLFAAKHLEEDLFFLFESKLRRSSTISLWTTCYDTTLKFFHMSLTATYAKRYMDLGGKSTVEMMFQDIKAVMLDNIKKAKWLDQETKKLALIKAEKSRAAIAFRDEFLDEKKMNNYYSSIKVGENHFINMKAAMAFLMRESMEGLHTKHIRFSWMELENLLTANAFYAPYENGVIIPIGILQEPIFAEGRPNYMNYGSLGSILGHEFTHAFDTSGGLYDAEGNAKMWWTNQSWTNYQEKKQCFVDQYNQYFESKVASFVNGTKTLGENISDNGGLAAIYEAYKNLLARIGEEERLPGLSFSERQMFWISFASTWCRKLTVRGLLSYMENAVHAPAKFRVNGALSNIKEFSEDFKCKPGSSLNPVKKCSLWK